MAAIGEADYRNGARERLDEAFVLLRQEHFAGSVYLAGRAVEGMLRALIWKNDRDYATGRKSLDTGHDLRLLLTRVQDLGVLGESRPLESLAASVQKVARLWSNNMRFLSTSRVQSEWFAMGEVGRKRTMKSAAQEYYESCSAIFKRCEALWQR